jgi:hypothetical protein
VKNFFLVSRTEYKTYDEIIGKSEEIALFQHLGILEELGLMVSAESSRLYWWTTTGMER